MRGLGVRERGEMEWGWGETNNETTQVIHTQFAASHLFTVSAMVSTYTPQHPHSHRITTTHHPKTYNTYNIHVRTSCSKSTGPGIPPSTSSAAPNTTSLRRPYMW